MSDIRYWSTTAASNTDSTNGGMPEGMAPSAVNDNVRTQLAAHRTQWEDAEYFDWGHTVAYSSATEFTVSNSVTNIYSVGRRLKFIGIGTGPLYGHVTTISAVSGTNTKFTVSLTSGNLTSSLSQVAVAILNPVTNSIPKGVGLDAPSVWNGTLSATTLNACTINGGGTTLSSAVSTSGTSVQLIASVPTWAKRIDINFMGVSSNGTSNWLIQVGDSGGLETTGYLGASLANGTTANGSTSGFIINNSNASAVVHGIVSLMLSDSSANTWVASGNLARSDTAFVYSIAGSKSLSAVLDRISITTVNGTDSFDAGTISVSYS